MRALPLAVVLAAFIAWPREAEAQCAPSTGYSPCIDANALWPSPGAQRFFALAQPAATEAGKLSFGFLAQVLFRPLLLEVPAPTEGAREVRLVDYTVEESLLFDAGLGHGFTLGAALGVVLYQRGAGIEGITSQRGAPLASTVNRDPRVRVAFARELGTVAVQPRFELALPLGEETAFAGTGAFTTAPGVALELRFARFRAGADIAARLRPAVELGTGRWGSQLAAAAGASYGVLADERLFVSGEVSALIPLVDSTSARGRSLGVESTWVPAEWLVSVGARPDADEPWQIVLGAGSGLAISSDEINGVRRSFLGPTSPRFRGVLALRYSPVRSGS